MDNGPKITWGWIVYRITDAKLEVLGIFETEQSAKRDVEVLAKHGMNFEIQVAPFLGWGYAAPGVIQRNGPPPLSAVH